MPPRSTRSRTRHAVSTSAPGTASPFRTAPTSNLFVPTAVRQRPCIAQHAHWYDAKRTHVGVVKCATVSDRPTAQSETPAPITSTRFPPPSPRATPLLPLKTPLRRKRHESSLSKGPHSSEEHPPELP